MCDSYTRRAFFIIAGNWERHKYGCLFVRAVHWRLCCSPGSTELSETGLWTVQPGFSPYSAPIAVHIPGQFGDFPPRTQPLHLIINWWVQSGSLQQQENHQVLNSEYVRPKPVQWETFKNLFITKSWSLNWSAILIKGFQCLKLNKQGFDYIQKFSDKLLEIFLTSSNAGQFHFWISLESWKLPLYTKNMIIVLSPTPSFDWPYLLNYSPVKWCICLKSSVDLQNALFDKTVKLKQNYDVKPAFSHLLLLANAFSIL